MKLCRVRSANSWQLVSLPSFEVALAMERCAQRSTWPKKRVVKKTPGAHLTQQMDPHDLNVPREGETKTLQLPSQPKLQKTSIAQLILESCKLGNK